MPQITTETAIALSIPRAGARSSSSSSVYTAELSPSPAPAYKGGIGVLSTVVGIGQVGVIAISAVVPIGIWLWGVLLYAMAGNMGGTVAAFFLPPVGMLHAVGVF